MFVNFCKKQNPLDCRRIGRPKKYNQEQMRIKQKKLDANLINLDTIKGSVPRNKAQNKNS